MVPVTLLETGDFYLGEYQKRGCRDDQPKQCALGGWHIWKWLGAYGHCSANAKRHNQCCEKSLG